MGSFRGIALLVSDLNRSTEFYSGLLGFQTLRVTPTKAELQFNSTQLILYPAPYSVKPWTGGFGVSLIFTTDDFQGLQDKLVQYGAKVIKKLAGKTLLLIDPDGYIIALTEEISPHIKELFHESFTME